MKITTYKGFSHNKLPEVIDRIMKEFNADSFGNFTIRVDAYKDGVKLDTKYEWFKVVRST